MTQIKLIKTMVYDNTGPLVTGNQTQGADPCRTLSPGDQACQATNCLTIIDIFANVNTYLPAVPAIN
jgi:hypothetical protein